MLETNHEFIRRYVRGDAETVAAVDGWILSAARAYRRRLAGEWEDVLQEIRMEVFRLLRSGRFRGEASLKTYLWRVTSHTCIDRIRAQQRGDWLVHESSKVLERAPERGSLAVRRETADLLLRVLDEVSGECRKIWRLILEGFSYPEMSRKLDVSEGALRVRALRCRRKAQAIRARLLAPESAAEAT